MKSADHKSASVQTLAQKAIKLLSEGNLDAAEKKLAGVKDDPKNYALNYALGHIHYGRARHNEAVKYFSHAVELNGSDPRVWKDLGLAFLYAGKTTHAVLVFHKLTKENETDPRYLSLLGLALLNLNASTYDKTYADIILFYLSHSNINPQSVGGVLHDLLVNDTKLSMLRYFAGSPEINATLLTGMELTQLNDPLLCAGIKNLLFKTPAFEIAFTNLRRYLLGIASETPDQLAIILPFLEALATQCHMTEYVYNEDANETKNIDHLTDTLKNAREWNDNTSVSMLMLACYRPLHSCLKGEWPLLSDQNRKQAAAPLKAVFQDQIDAYIQEQDIKTKIPLLREVDDDVSGKVRTMYEENPYPRWKKASIAAGNAKVNEDYNAMLEKPRDGRLKILIAGCGTGRQIATVCSQHPNAEITAVDLSLSSIAYAKRRCDEMGFKNVKYMQADILDLGDLKQDFDIVECAGVLHHMKDPMAGWTVLCGLLRTGGFMYIGLYSELARQCIVAARDLIAANGYPATLEGIRACREAIKTLPQGHKAREIIPVYDFYATSACRDLIFHVQEHRFSTPQIKECLEKLGLDFVCFNHMEKTIDPAYVARFPDDPLRTNLDNWNIFEQENPNIFDKMYQFWCQKKS